MTVTEARSRAGAVILVDRVLNDPGEKCSDRDLAFRLCILRRWITRAGGADVEFTTEDGRGWMLTRRGNVVADETVAVTERAA